MNREDSRPKSTLGAQRASLGKRIQWALQREPPMLVRIALLLAFVGAAVQGSGLYHLSTANAVLGVLTTTLLFLVMGSLGRVLYSIFSILFILLLVFQIMVLHFYGQPDYQFFLSLKYTSPSEAFGYLSDLVSAKAVLSIILAIPMLYILLIKIRIDLQHKTIVSAAVIILIAIPPYRFNANHSQIDEDTNLAIFGYEIPTKIILNTAHCYSTISDLVHTKDQYKASYDWSALDDLKPKQLNIVVIGESSRADFYGVNGFHTYDLTPNIDSTYTYNFSHCYSLASHTIGSLTRTLFLTDSTFDMIPEANLVALMRSKGALTYWVTNQGFVGQYNSPISSLALGCDSTYFMNKGNWHTSTGPDRAMLPTIRRIISHAKVSARPTCLFIHLQGSHPPLKPSSSAEKIPYNKNPMLASYMGSIRETDDVIGNILREAQSMRDYNIFYFSDHGISYMADKNYFMHRDDYLENYWVPFVIWSSPGRAKQRVEHPVSLNNFIDIFHYFNLKNTAHVDSLLSTFTPPGTVFNSENRPIALRSRGRNRIDL